MAPSPHAASPSVPTSPIPFPAFPASPPDAPATPQLTAEEVAAVTELLARARRVVERGYVPLTDAERRFGARFRSGTEVVLRVLARVVDAQNVFLPAGLSIRAAQAELEAADELRPLADAAADLSKLLSDRVRRSEREAQSIGSAAYAALTAVGKRDSAVRRALAPAREYLRRSKRPPTAEAPSLATGASALAANDR